MGSATVVLQSDVHAGQLLQAHTPLVWVMYNQMEEWCVKIKTVFFLTLIHAPD